MTYRCHLTRLALVAAVTLPFPVGCGGVPPGDAWPGGDTPGDDEPARDESDEVTDFDGTWSDADSDADTDAEPEAALEPEPAFEPEPEPSAGPEAFDCGALPLALPWSYSDGNASTSLHLDSGTGACDLDSDISVLWLGSHAGSAVLVFEGWRVMDGAPGGILPETGELVFKDVPAVGETAEVWLTSASGSWVAITYEAYEGFQEPGGLLITDIRALDAEDGACVAPMTLVPDSYYGRSGIGLDEAGACQRLSAAALTFRRDAYAQSARGANGWEVRWVIGADEQATSEALYAANVTPGADVQVKLQNEAGQIVYVTFQFEAGSDRVLVLDVDAF